jgi:hypothetical protein
MLIGTRNEKAVQPLFGKLLAQQSYPRCAIGRIGGYIKSLKSHERNSQ